MRRALAALRPVWSVIQSMGNVTLTVTFGSYIAGGSWREVKREPLGLAFLFGWTAAAPVGLRLPARACMVGRCPLATGPWLRLSGRIALTDGSFKPAHNRFAFGGEEPCG